MSTSIGFPQLILLLVAAVGLGLLIFSLMGLLRGSRTVFEDEDGRRYYSRRRRQLKWKSGVGGILLLILSVSLLWFTFLAQTYLALSSDIQVARVRATPIEGQPHMMSVELMTYNDQGQQTSDKTYLVHGDQWMLQGNVIKYRSWVNFLGFHTSYKLTRLEGRYSDTDLELKGERTVIPLNGGDDNFFKATQEQAWTSPFIEAAYGNATYLQPDGKSYDVFLSLTGFHPKPAQG